MSALLIAQPLILEKAPSLAVVIPASLILLGMLTKNYWRNEIMANSESFESVWDALEEDPVKAENMKLRSALMIAIVDHINTLGLTQVAAAKKMHITQPRVSALIQGKIEAFRLDTLIDLFHKLGMHVTMKIAA